ncbi:sulfatase-like hydrolase/transferase [Akkermansiaceae bacterium]|nr:sulfatase-like hydrolase/transferase [Akkermansiaceae bacterium]
MVFRLLLALTLTAAAHDVGGKGHLHTAPQHIEKPRIEDTIQANIYADNWFALYINGQLVATDPIPFIPHNVVTLDILPEYPMTIAVMARDNADPKTGMEYDNTSIGDGGFILKFSDGTVTTASWKAKDFFHGPINSDTANPKVRATPIPENWFATDFDDSSWANAKEFTEQEIDPKKPYFDHDFKGAKWIWSDDLKLDNTVIFRTRIASAPDGRKANPNWPKGHILPSASSAPFLTAGIQAPHDFSHRLDPSAPPQAKAFAPFAESLEIKWDERFVIVGTNSLPDHPMMKGITAWNQQVPLPQDFFGENAWHIPLHPVPSPSPVSAKTSLFKGAIAVAINGVPIFNPIKQDGRTDTKLAGELDEYGGHAGRADDYHYHLPPTFLSRLVGDTQPIGFAMDGYPLYGFNEPDGSPAKDLDAFNGHEHGVLGYHYHSSLNYPYLNGGLKGQVEIRDDQVADQPRTQGIRPYTQPLRGAAITDFSNPEEGRYSLTYELGGKSHRIDYSTKPEGGADFAFVAPDGTTTKESYTPHQRRPDGEKGERKPGEKGKRPRDRPEEPRGKEQAGDAPRTPWILVHAPEIDANKDGTLTLEELLADVKAVFDGYDADKDGHLTEPGMTQGKSGVHSALDGFVRQHNLEMDSDDDSKVSAAEMTGQFKRFLDKNDANGDGKLSPDELKVEGEIKPRLPDKKTPAQPDSPKPQSSIGKGKPNVIFILIDDMGWNDVGFAGNKSIETPNIAKLAAEGMRFSAAYAPSPVCSPTRISLQTGMSCARLQWTKASPVMTATDGYKLIPPAHRRSIREDETTVAELLKTAGYATAHYGKWHLNGGGPEKHGYDESDGETSNGDAAQFKGDNPVDIVGMGTRAAAFMKKSHEAGKPFFIQMSYHALHYPENANPKSVEKFKALLPNAPAHIVQRAAITYDLDAGIGQILKDLDTLDLAKNTWVIYMSDNGAGGSKGGKGGGRSIQGGKGSLWEGGIRVPLIIRGPGVAPDSWCHGRVVGFDLFPTFCGLAGVTELPKDIDGGSILPQLRGSQEPVKRPREELVFHFPHYQGDTPHSAIYLGDFKLIHFYETGENKLFNIRDDIGEKSDISKEMPDKTAGLSAKLSACLTEVKAQLPTENPQAVPGKIHTGEKGDKKEGKGKKRK